MNGKKARILAKGVTKSAAAKHAARNRNRRKLQTVKRTTATRGRGFADTIVTPPLSAEDQLATHPLTYKALAANSAKWNAALSQPTADVPTEHGQLKPEKFVFVGDEKKLSPRTGLLICILSGSFMGWVAWYCMRVLA